ncbi:EF hand [Aquisphaera giovannonii]|uniref:EF hand n=1 Tax=Aquisphaera giovannonii TaxID=406548 RepID=A0A5B9W3T0_9BACT|nr:DUF3500 domain-containing protein [Aquisphaera giovannonii]QEH34745.1 EF hand [Aquisphaera giovannonii]
MNRSLLLGLLAAAGTLPIGLAAAHLGPAPNRSVDHGQAAAPTPALLESPNVAAVVDAAKAFLGTLTDEQRHTAQIDLSRRLAARWSNFPGGSNLRNGVFFRDLKAPQVYAAMKVARLALGEEGFARFQEIRAADDVLGNLEGKRGPGRRGPGGGPPGGDGPGGPPPGGGPFEDADANKDGRLSKDEAPDFLRDQFAEIDADKDGFISREEDRAFMRRRAPGGPGGPFGGPGGPGGGPGGPFGGPGGGYGAANYMIAILGQPSTTTPWLLQFGGHHLAFNIYYRGTAAAATPYFLAVEPTTWTDESGKAHGPLAPMKDAMAGLLRSLTPEQVSKARLNRRFNDVYVGPGRDGKFPAREGVPVSELSDASKAFVKRAIAAWTADNAQAESYRRLYEADLDGTTVSFSGTTTLEARGDYVRIDGPRVWIEFASQGGVVVRDQVHYHTIWRDRLTDYGAEFSF